MMPPLGSFWRPPALRLLRLAVTKSARAVGTTLANATRPLRGRVRPVLTRSRHAVRHALALRPVARIIGPSRLRIPSSSWTSGAIGPRLYSQGRKLTTLVSIQNKKSSPSSSPTLWHISRTLSKSPFASTLRPTLTGGALPRTAGGYSLGGGARFFSHTPAAPAQVINNVSHATRAFLLSGKRFRYDGSGPNGEKRYRAVSELVDGALRRISNNSKTAPGAFIDFPLGPIVTALSPLSPAAALASGPLGSSGDSFAMPGNTLHAEGLLELLSVDFGRTMKDLAAVLADVRRLANLGDLPITLENNTTLRIHFPGVDGLTVSRLCDDIGIQRGVVNQEEPLETPVMQDSVQFYFPFAPDAPNPALASPGGATGLLQGDDSTATLSLESSFLTEDVFALGADEISPSLSESGDLASMPTPGRPEDQMEGEFEGLEGIYRFLEECDRAMDRIR